MQYLGAIPIDIMTDLTRTAYTRNDYQFMFGYIQFLDGIFDSSKDKEITASRTSLDFSKS